MDGQLVLLSRVMWEYVVHMTLSVPGLCRRDSRTSLLRDFCNQRVKLSTYLHLVPRLKRVGQAYVFIEWCLCVPHVLVKNCAHRVYL